MGAEVSTRCAQCTGVLPPGSRFCPSCGQPTELSATVTTPDGDGSASARLASAAERRHVTVAFCDLVGSTELSSTVDAETFSDLIHAYHECAVGVAHQYEAQVDHYSGDGINLVFGWPRAHDDDAERAVRCSLDIVTAMHDQRVAGQQLSVRIGVHSGVVVVGEMGASGHRSVMALGETMNVAARLQSQAETDTVLISSTTLKLVGEAFDTTSIGRRELKGIAEPVEAHVVHRWSGARSRFDGSRGRLSSFVGRDAESAALLDRWDAARAGHGSAVLVIGEAGVGKSRLTYELRQQLSDGDHLWLECGASSYTQGSVLRPAIDLVINGLGIQRDDDVGDRAAKVRDGLRAAGLGTGDVGTITTMLSAAGTGPVDPLATMRERLGRRTIESLCRWVTALSRLQPIVLVVHDLHWCDDVTLQLLDELAARSQSSALLLLMTARPEYTAWPHDTPVHRIDLTPIEPRASRALMRTVAGGRNLPEVVVDKILADTGGIPLFVEEVCRTALESGHLIADGDRWILAGPVDSFEIPTSLQASLMARLDRLGPAKDLAQLAAVIGREFTFELLADVSNEPPEDVSDALSVLIERAVVLEDGSQSNPRYVFRHALMRDAAYESVLRRDQRELHRRIAECLTRRGGIGTTVPQEVVARHFDAGGQVVEAVACYTRAAYDAVARSGFREAAGHLGRSIELLGELPASAERDAREIDLQLLYGSSVIAAHGYADPATETAYGRVRELCEAKGDAIGAAQAMAGLSIYYTNRGDMVLGAQLGEEALAIGMDRDDDLVSLLGCVQIAHPRINQARPDVGLEYAQRALALYDAERHSHVAFQFGTDQGIAAHMFAGWASGLLGLADQALDYLDRAVALANQLEKPFDIAYATFFRGTIQWVRGDVAGSLASAALARKLSKEHGFDFLSTISRAFELAGELETFHERALVPELLAAAGAAAESGNLAGSPVLLTRVAEGVWAGGDVDLALEMVDVASAIADDTGQPSWNAELHRMRAELRLATADTPEAIDAARAELRTAVDLATERGFLFHEVRARTSLTRLLARDGRHDASARALREACRRCTEGQATPVYTRALDLLAELGA
jgi:class 3 adenylate cyclase/tetratricopeptide (TPR) repeat protein